jgi:hypothetical protein
MGYNKVVLETTANTIAQNTTGSSATLTTARAIAFSGGDVTGTGNFNGSADTAINLTIGAGVVDNTMIASLAVRTAHIGADQITNAQIDDGVINPENLNGTLANGTAEDILVSDGDGSFSWETRPVNNNTLTLVGGTGMSDAIGDFTANQASDESLTINLDINDLTASTDITAGDSFAFYDLSGTDHKKSSITSLGTYMAGSGLTANSGVIAINLTGLSDIGETVTKSDAIIGLNASASNATVKYTVENLSTFQAGTGISNNNGKLDVDAAQAITSVTGNFAIAGDLTVSGAMITTATETLEIADNTMLLNSDLTGSTAVDAGLVANRADATGDKYQHLFWDESKTGWCIGSDDSSSAFPSTSSKLMINVEKTDSGAPSGTETTVGGMVYNSADNEMYIRTS